MVRDAEDKKGKKANIFNLSILCSIWVAEGKGTEGRGERTFMQLPGGEKYSRRILLRKNYLKLSLKAEEQLPNRQ